MQSLTIKLTPNISPFKSHTSLKVYKSVSSGCLWVGPKSRGWELNPHIAALQAAA